MSVCLYFCVFVCLCVCVFWCLCVFGCLCVCLFVCLLCLVAMCCVVAPKFHCCDHPERCHFSFSSATHYTLFQSLHHSVHNDCFINLQQFSNQLTLIIQSIIRTTPHQPNYHQLAYCVVEFLEKDASLTEPVSHFFALPN